MGLILDLSPRVLEKVLYFADIGSAKLQQSFQTIVSVDDSPVKIV